MRLTARADFAYGNTRLHARRGDLLRAPDYERLLDQDVEGVLEQLQSTAYGPDAEAAGRSAGVRRLHETIRLHVGRTLEEMRTFYVQRARTIVDVLLSHLDVHNVVTVLRAQTARRRPAEESLDALFKAGWLDDPLAREVLGQRELAGAVDVLVRRMPDRAQATALRTAYREYERTTDLAALERAVVADHAARSAVTLSSGRDATTLLRFARREIDERNLLIALRLRDSPVPSSPGHALLPGGSLPLAAFTAAVRAPAPPAAAAALAALGGKAWQAPLQRWAAAGDLLALERELERRRIADACALFLAGDPLGVDVPIAFTAAKHAEARNLRLLGAASAHGLPTDTVRRELLWPESWT